MLEETDENWSECIDRTLELKPDCVTIYQMEVPFNTTIYKNMKEAGRLSAPVADWPQKRQWVTKAFSRPGGSRLFDYQYLHGGKKSRNY